MLTQQGHRVIVADNGVAGLALYQPGFFDLVITDQAMPEMNGEQMAIAIREQSPHLPVIMITGFGDLMQARGEEPRGIDLILAKPCTATALQDAIRQVLDLSHHKGDTP